MKTIDLIALEAAQSARKARRLELENAALRRKAYARSRGRSPDGALPNVYQLHTSGQPTGEFREMMHMEAIAMTNAMRQDFLDKVNAAIDAGSKHEGKLSQWKLYKHHSEKEAPSQEAREAKGRALSHLEGARKSQKRIR
jgi:hypothetical protein